MFQSSKVGCHIYKQIDLKLSQPLEGVAFELNRRNVSNQGLNDFEQLEIELKLLQPFAFDINRYNGGEQGLSELELAEVQVVCPTSIPSRHQMLSKVVFHPQSPRTCQREHCERTHGSLQHQNVPKSEESLPLSQCSNKRLL